MLHLSSLCSQLLWENKISRLIFFFDFATSCSYVMTCSLNSCSPCTPITNSSPMAVFCCCRNIVVNSYFVDSSPMYAPSVRMYMCGAPQDWAQPKCTYTYIRDNVERFFSERHSRMLHIHKRMYVCISFRS